MSEVAATGTAKKLALFALAMFGFGYALVPLYDVFCDITGINGKTGKISVAEVIAQDNYSDRWVTVEFDTNINTALPWRFEAVEYKQKVRLGEINEALFIVENTSADPVSGRAVPSVAPALASLFFNKTECFCFVKQTLAPGERREMKVRFVVDTELPNKISTMTLSYTFFGVSDSDSKQTILKG